MRRSCQFQQVFNRLVAQNQALESMEHHNKGIQEDLAGWAYNNAVIKPDSFCSVKFEEMFELIMEYAPHA